MWNRVRTEAWPSEMKEIHMWSEAIKREIICTLPPS